MFYFLEVPIKPDIGFTSNIFQYARDETRKPTNQIYGKPDLWKKRLSLSLDTKVG
jgi:hypothetical protein